jgi:MFS family permease
MALGDRDRREGAMEAATRASAVLLTRWQLSAISVYWLAINALNNSVGPTIVPNLTTKYICGPLSDEACAAANASLQPIFGDVTVSLAIATAIIGMLGVVMALVVQPVAGSVSDFTTTRWGRRKPYIVIGVGLDMIFLLGLAVSNSYLSLLAFVVLLQFSSNLAQGPFQGYIPDLVPAPQVGIASSAMGLMILLGLILGSAIAGVAIAFHNVPAGLAAVGVLELVTMIITVRSVREPQIVPPRREGKLAYSVRSTIAEVLGHHNFLWLLASRLFILMTSGMVFFQAFYFLTRSIGLTKEQEGITFFVVQGLIAAATMLAVVPAGKLSDRYGRKRVIYVACLFGFVGLSAFALVPRDPLLHLPFDAVIPAWSFVLIPLGVGSGMFLAVDWALMTDIIPKRTAGRYMGISNVVTASSGAIAGFIGAFIVDTVDRSYFGTGPRLALLLASSFFIIGMLLLRHVDERRVELAEEAQVAEVVRQPISSGSGST